MKKMFFIILLYLSGCALFKKTSQTTAKASQSSVNQLEVSQLVLKSAGRETQIFTYWNDSGFYQVQHVKELLEQAESGKITTEEKQHAKHGTKVKRAEPANLLLYGWVALVLVLAVVFCYFYKK